MPDLPRVLREGHQGSLDLSADHGIRYVPQQILGVELRIETIEAHEALGIQAADSVL